MLVAVVLALMHPGVLDRTAAALSTSASTQMATAAATGAAAPYGPEFLHAQIDALLAFCESHHRATRAPWTTRLLTRSRTLQTVAGWLVPACVPGLARSADESLCAGVR